MLIVLEDKKLLVYSYANYARYWPHYRLQLTIQLSDNDLPRKSYFLMLITVTKDDVMRCIKNRTEYKKVNAFKDMRVDIYI